MSVALHATTSSSSFFASLPPPPPPDRGRESEREHGRGYEMVPAPFLPPPRPPLPPLPPPRPRPPPSVLPSFVAASLAVSWAMCMENEKQNQMQRNQDAERSMQGRRAFCVKEFNRRILDSKDLKELSNFVARHSSVLNHVNIATAFCVAFKVSRGGTR